jgi:hypothetical protein
MISGVICQRERRFQMNKLWAILLIGALSMFPAIPVFADSFQGNSKGSSDEIIGEWLDNSPYGGAKYTFLKRNGKIIMIRKFKDGSGSEKEMIQKKQSGMLRFEEKAGNDDGEYYLIERNSSLNVYDKLGLIITMPPIK